MTLPVLALITLASGAVLLAPGLLALDVVYVVILLAVTWKASHL